MPASADRIELILEQLDALPTLGAVAVRVIELTSREDSSADELIEVISSDPALAARVLKLSRCIDRARAKTITTVDRAVLHLGFEAMRSVALSVGVFDQLDRLAIDPGERRSEPAVFDRRAFWRHSLAVASISEQLAATRPLKSCMSMGEAFLAGLLHDLGLLALHVLLPRSTDRVCKLAETAGLSLEQACSRLIGITPHTAGRRLAERWNLPRPLTDVLWLNGQRFEMLPAMPHAPLVKLVTLADAVARGRYITPAGHTFRGDPILAMAADLGLRESEVERVIKMLPETIAARADALGLDLEPDTAVLLDSITRANESLGRLNAALHKRAEQGKARDRMLKSVIGFHAERRPEDSVPDVLARIVASAAPIIGRRPIAAVYCSGHSETWRLMRLARGAEGAPSESIGHVPLGLESMGVSTPVPRHLAALLTTTRGDHRPLRLLPIRCRSTLQAALVYEEQPAADDDWSAQVETLSVAWATALDAAAQREQAGRLSDALAHANRLVTEAQDELARQRASAAVGEIVAGVAHEMNNPLTVISGRSQQLLLRQKEPALRSMAEEIVRESHRLSDMLTTLRRLTEPAHPKRRPVDLARMVMVVLQQFQPHGKQEFEINTVIADSLPEAHLDPDQIGMALAELVRNAVESKGARHIEVRVQTEGANDRLKLQVRDDGAGLSLHALTHAFEPFFSSKGAGRQPGLGLAHARRYVEAHGGHVSLENGPNGGAVATIWIEDCFLTEKRRGAA